MGVELAVLNISMFVKGIILNISFNYILCNINIYSKPHKASKNLSMYYIYIYTYIYALLSHKNSIDHVNFSYSEKMERN